LIDVFLLSKPTPIIGAPTLTPGVPKALLLPPVVWVPPIAVDPKAPVAAVVVPPRLLEEPKPLPVPPLALEPVLPMLPEEPMPPLVLLPVVCVLEPLFSVSVVASPAMLKVCGVVPKAGNPPDEDPDAEELLDELLLPNPAPDDPTPPTPDDPKGEEDPLLATPPLFMPGVMPACCCTACPNNPMVGTRCSP